MITMNTEQALQCLFGAFRWLEEKGLPLKVELLANIPLIITNDPRLIYLFIETFMNIPTIERREYTRHVKKPTFWNKIMNFTYIKSFIFDLITNYEKYGDIFSTEKFFAFTYYDKPHSEGYAYKKVKENQLKPFEREFKSKYGEDKWDDLWVIRVDSCTQSGNCSIEENITKLILTLYFRDQGYLVRGDIGRMMDIIVFDILLIEKLREIKIAEKGAKIEELPLSFIFPIKETYLLKNKNKIIAIEVESYNPYHGIKQLKKWIKPSSLTDLFGKYCQPFDRAVISAPNFDEELEDIDVLTYNKEGIHYLECKGDNITEKYKIIGKETGIKYAEYLVKDIYNTFIESIFIELLKKTTSQLDYIETIKLSNIIINLIKKLRTNPPLLDFRPILTFKLG